MRGWMQYLVAALFFLLVGYVWFLLQQFQAAYQFTITMEEGEIVAAKYHALEVEDALLAASQAFFTEAIFSFAESGFSYNGVPEWSIATKPNFTWIEEVYLPDGSPSWLAGENVTPPTYNYTTFLNVTNLTLRTLFLSDLPGGYDTGVINGTFFYELGSVSVDKSVVFDFNVSVFLRTANGEVSQRASYNLSYDVPLYEYYLAGLAFVNGSDAMPLGKLNFSGTLFITASQFYRSDQRDALVSNITELFKAYVDAISREYGLYLELPGVRYCEASREIIRGNISPDVSVIFKTNDGDLIDDYNAYLIIYDFIANVTNYNYICCNWHEDIRHAVKEPVRLQFRVKDALLALECDEHHVGVVWGKHRFDNKTLACFNDTLDCNGNSDYEEWKESEKLAVGLYDMDADNKYEALWNGSTWIKCQKHYGDDLPKKSGTILNFSSGVYNTSTAETCSPGVQYTSRGGQILCWDSDWKKCFEEVQDFHVIDEFCCIASLSHYRTTAEICKKEQQKDDQYCCECFGNTWHGTSRFDPNGFCIGDGICEYDVGENVTNSPRDCCEADGTAVYDDICYLECGSLSICDGEKKNSKLCDGDYLVTCCKQRVNCDSYDTTCGDFGIYSDCCDSTSRRGRFKDYYCDVNLLACEWRWSDCCEPCGSGYECINNVCVTTTTTTTTIPTTTTTLTTPSPI